MRNGGAGVGNEIFCALESEKVTFKEFIFCFRDIELALLLLKVDYVRREIKIQKTCSYLKSL